MLPPKIQISVQHYTRSPNRCNKARKRHKSYTDGKSKSNVVFIKKERKLSLPGHKSGASLIEQGEVSGLCVAEPCLPTPPPQPPLSRELLRGCVEPKCFFKGCLDTSAQGQSGLPVCQEVPPSHPQVGCQLMRA